MEGTDMMKVRVLLYRLMSDLIIMCFIHVYNDFK